MLKEEQETTVNYTRVDDKVRIYSSIPSDIRLLRKNAAVTEIKSGVVDGGEYAFFEIDAERWNPVSGVKRRVNISPEKRAELASRLEKARSAAK